MEVIVGNAKSVMDAMEPQSVDCIVTSPPYWQARAYMPAGHELAGMEIGREPTVEEYVDNLAAVLGSAKRVLKDAGTFWLNLGDCQHAGSLQLLPFRVASRLQLAGWFLRSAAPWIKRCPMPESTLNRPSNGLEYVFMLTKKKSGYFYDADAVRKPVAESTLARDKYTRITSGKDGPYAVRHDHETPSNPKGRNRRNTDWWVETVGDEIVGFDAANKAFKGAHFAVMPSGVIEPCILAGCPEGGTVLDPFCGSGTVLAVAEKHKRVAIGIELNEEFAIMAKERVA
jgi:site-specific DNA-methyltransferase (adenine-specific)